ncbi:hypothetical protein CIHG_10313 [Coccidioides immitis H538.4]|uniref:Uncharacterized protein n=1 Tax=Coccidioides immitis H538.4 TaxID=396776 RepID=A0A0J8S6J6_COCIT|nr:hypothetical protein CIHG_10313 [Coccidioides immitis H538.4]
MANTVSFDCGRSTIELSSRSTWWIKARLLDGLDDDSPMTFKKSVHDGRMMVAVATRRNEGLMSRFKVVPLGSVDIRKLNQIVEPDAYPAAGQEEIISAIVGLSHRGQDIFNVAVMGLINRVSYVQRQMGLELWDYRDQEENELLPSGETLNDFSYSDFFLSRSSLAAEGYTNLGSDFPSHSSSEYTCLDWSSGSTTQFSHQENYIPNNIPLHGAKASHLGVSKS